MSYPIRQRENLVLGSFFGRHGHEVVDRHTHAAAKKLVHETVEMLAYEAVEKPVYEAVEKHVHEAFERHIHEIFERLADETFERLADEWERDRTCGADIAPMTQHPAYQSIIQMGEPAVPRILQRLARKPDHWFVALNAITGANPVPPESYGRLREMVAAWRAWGQRQGYGPQTDVD